MHENGREFDKQEQEKSQDEKLFPKIDEMGYDASALVLCSQTHSLFFFLPKPFPL